MIPSAEPKSSTRQILISEPDEEKLLHGLQNRHLSPDLLRFLQRVIKTNKWTRKINIPSTHDDIAAVLVFASDLKEDGLEIFSELHVFFAGKIIVEKWQVVGVNDQIASVPAKVFSSVELEKVRRKQNEIEVTLQVPMADGANKTMVKTFDFAADGPNVRVVPNPLI